MLLASLVLPAIASVSLLVAAGAQAVSFGGRGQTVSPSLLDNSPSQISRPPPVVCPRAPEPKTISASKPVAGGPHASCCSDRTQPPPQMINLVLRGIDPCHLDLSFCWSISMSKRMSVLISPATPGQWPKPVWRKLRSLADQADQREARLRWGLHPRDPVESRAHHPTIDAKHLIFFTLVFPVRQAAQGDSHKQPGKPKLHNSGWLLGGF